MRQITPVYLFAIFILLAAVALAAAAAPPQPARATAAPEPQLRYSTLNSCSCEVLATDAPTATVDAAPVPLFSAWLPTVQPAGAPRN